MSYTVNADSLSGSTVTLDSGETVTVTIEQKRLPNGRVSYEAKAKCGKVETEYHHSADAPDPEYAREALLIVLGEPAPAKPKIMLADGARLTASIRHHLALENAPPINPADLL